MRKNKKIKVAPHPKLKHLEVGKEVMVTYQLIKSTTGHEPFLVNTLGWGWYKVPMYPPPLARGIFLGLSVIRAVTREDGWGEIVGVDGTETVGVVQLIVPDVMRYSRPIYVPLDYIFVEGVHAVVHSKMPALRIE